jgi:uncharacterized protein (DUF362 family)
MVHTLLQKTGALDRIRPDNRVLIKPNLVASRPNWTGIDTDPRIIEALIIALKDRGVHRITVGDGSGMGYSAAKAFDYCGYRNFASRFGISLVDLEKDRFIEKPVLIDGPFKSLKIARTVIECDFFINAPIMKAHGQTLITCSLKNLKGVMPRAMKTAFHSQNLHQAIAQLNSILSPHLIVVDGLKGDLCSETGHDPVAMDRIMLGSNPVEVDSVVADMLGYAPRDIRHIACSTDAGLGTCQLSQIEIHSLNRPSKIRRFHPPKPFSKRFPCRVIDQGACCTCMGNLMYALERLNERGLLSQKLSFLLGQETKVTTLKNTFIIAVGKCASKAQGANLVIDECPPPAGHICRLIESSDQQIS